MVPDLPTIEWRRHTVTILIRLLIAAYGAWCVYLLASECFAPCLEQLVTSPGNANLTMFNLFGTVVYRLPFIAVLFVFLSIERMLVRWIVPVPPRELGCPKCGYSLKGIKSPICPECGANLGR